MSGAIGVVRHALRVRVSAPTLSFDRALTTRALRQITPPTKYTNYARLMLRTDLPMYKISKICDEVYELPENFDGFQVRMKFNKTRDLMSVKRILERYRQTPGSPANDEMRELEDKILEVAFQAGNQQAIAIQCVEVLKDPETSKEDKAIATDMIKELVSLRNPLALRLTAEQEMARGNLDEAERLFQRSITAARDHLETIPGDERRSYDYVPDYDIELQIGTHAQLGKFYLKTGAHAHARAHFLEAIETTQFTDQRLDKVILPVHLILGSIFYKESNYLRAQYHWRRAAAAGIPAAMLNLGSLEAAVFGNYKVAHEWFSLGAEFFKGDQQVLAKKRLAEVAYLSGDASGIGELTADLGSVDVTSTANL
ncbi:uncharacterized protein V1510DRAFT_419801 [Dipodascopsis tothii]|uniref:uncharacterized protein n=1 Tax=Dipodascopsis tothii TaxID=44089 RepID=UPI0034CF5376